MFKQLNARRYPKAPQSFAGIFSSYINSKLIRGGIYEFKERHDIRLEPHVPPVTNYFIPLI